MSIGITRMLIILGALLVLGSVNYSIWHKEQIKRDGMVIFVELAPVDPRSLMQGDYMVLNFQLAREIERDLRSTAFAAPVSADQPNPAAFVANSTRPHNGEMRVAAITLDEKSVARYAAKPAGNTRNIGYRIRNDRVWLGTNAFFFEEGRAQQYANARYGEFRLDVKSGEAVLVGLRNSEMQPL